MASKENPSVNKNCPVSATIRLIGGKYKALLLWHLTGQTLRFNQLHRLVPEATPKMLTQQLRELEEDGLISRTVYPVVPPRVDYSLTALGESLSRSDVSLGQRPDAGRRAYAGMYDDRQLQYDKKRTGGLPLLFLSRTFKILSYTSACRTIPIPMGYGPVCTPIVAPI